MPNARAVRRAQIAQLKNDERALMDQATAVAADLATVRAEREALIVEDFKDNIEKRPSDLPKVVEPPVIGTGDTG